METKLLFEVVELLFPLESFEQFSLGSFSLGDVLGEGEDVRCVVEFNGFGRKQNG
jgi:hypothetical protein